MIEEEHDSIPYYHSGIPETLRKIYDTALILLEKNGNVHIEENAPLTNWLSEEPIYKTLEIKEYGWENAEAEATYKLEQFQGQSAIEVHNSIMFFVKRVFPDGISHRVHCFSLKNQNNGSTRVQEQTQILETTKTEDEKSEKLMKNVVAQPNGWKVAISDTTTDEIAHEYEIMLSILTEELLAH